MNLVVTAMVAVGVLAAAPAFAQQFDQQIAPQAARPATAPPASSTPIAGQRGLATPPAVPAAETPSIRRVDPGTDQSDVNIKLSITVTDKSGTVSQSKVATMMLANLGSGRLRSSNQRSAVLNADAYAEMRKSGLVKLNLTVGYTPESDPQALPFDVSQTVSLFVKDGVPTVVTQAADPTKNGRTVTIEVTASVVK